VQIKDLQTCQLTSASGDSDAQLNLNQSQKTRMKWPIVKLNTYLANHYTSKFTIVTYVNLLIYLLILQCPQPSAMPSFGLHCTNMRLAAGLAART